MALPALYAPLHPDLDNFLFAPVGEERDGIPLSVISALTGLGLDPWAEAARLSSLEKSEAVEQLVPIITRLPGGRWPMPEVRKIALGLIELLPSSTNARVTASIRLHASAKIAPSKSFWVICFLLAAAAFVSMAASGSLPFGNHGRSTPAAQTEAPVRSG